MAKRSKELIKQGLMFFPVATEVRIYVGNTLLGTTVR